MGIPLYIQRFEEAGKKLHRKVAVEVIKDGEELRVTTRAWGRSWVFRMRCEDLYWIERERPGLRDAYYLNALRGG